MSATCTVPKKHRHPNRFEPCGAPAFYVWTPRGRPDIHQIMCKACGEGSAGNYTDELTRMTAGDAKWFEDEVKAERQLEAIFHPKP